MWVFLFFQGASHVAIVGSTQSRLNAALAELEGTKTANQQISGILHDVSLPSVIQVSPHQRLSRNWRCLVVVGAMFFFMKGLNLGVTVSVYSGLHLGAKCVLHPPPEKTRVFWLVS